MPLRERCRRQPRWVPGRDAGRRRGRAAGSRRAAVGGHAGRRAAGLEPRARPAPPGPHAAPHPVTLVCVNPDGMPGVRDELGPAPFDGRHVVGLWWWEVASFPAHWARGFDGLDEVWAGTRFVADAIAAVSPVPVVHVPTPVAQPVVAPVGREALGLPKDALARRSRLRLRQRGRAQEPARRDRGVHPRVRPQRRRGARRQDAALGHRSRSAPRRARRRRRRTRTCTSSTATCRRRRRTRSSGCSTACCPCIAPRASGSRSRRPRCSACRSWPPTTAGRATS